MINYTLFKDQIDKFEDFSKYQENDSFDCFYQFLDFYKEIVNDDSMKPMFIQFAKNKKNNLSNKNYKFSKFSRENDDKKAWSIKKFIKNDDKTIVFIKTTLNKISDETYDLVSDELLEGIYKLEYDETIREILSNEIINKCIYENKYRKLYIKLCYKIWSDIEFHKRMFYVDCDVEKPNVLYYVTKSTNVRSNRIFSSEEDIGKYIFNLFNFKDYFINHIHKIIYSFNAEYYSFNNLDEEEANKRKKYTLGIFELVNILSSNKHMNVDVVHILMVKLIHLNDTFEPIHNFEYEILYNIVKYLFSLKELYGSYNVFYKEFTNYLGQILANNSLPKRIEFFVTEIIDMLSKMSGISENNIMITQPLNSNNQMEIIKTNFKSGNIRGCKDIITKINNDNRLQLINNLLLYIIEQRNITNDMIKLLNDLNTKEIERELYTICNNIDDIMLDIPNANDKCIKLINELNIQKRQNVILMLSDICSDNSDDE